MARKKGPQVEQAYEHIKNRILTFDMPPGMQVSDTALALKLEMSRSPVREAIMRLIADGLIESEGGRTLVMPMSKNDIIEICQVREAVETTALHIISEKGGMTTPQKKELTRIFNLLKDSTDLVENYHYDDLFHNAFMMASGNNRLVNISNRMRLQISRARWLNFVLPKRKSDAQDEHTDIYTALMNDDYTLAKNSLKKHLDSTAQNFLMVLNSPQYNPQYMLALASLAHIGSEDSKTV